VRQRFWPVTQQSCRNSFFRLAKHMGLAEGGFALVEGALGKWWFAHGSL
jgi:hypothetical protein